MPNEEHVKLLRLQGVEAWNAWRRTEPSVVPDLRRAHLPGADLRGANLSGENLSGVTLTGAHLGKADLRDVKRL